MKWGKRRRREEVVVLCSHLIKDHFSRHRLRGGEYVCASELEIIKEKMRCIFPPLRINESRFLSNVEGCDS